MLLFIDCHVLPVGTCFYFNTSHVTVYLARLNRSGNIFCHFNTSHVTVYQPPEDTCPWCVANFNTSHVTVYPSSASNPPPNNSFQYISCYCLSRSYHSLFYSIFISIHLMLLFIQTHLFLCSNLFWFQYISCYCLSADLEDIDSIYT